MLQVMGAMLLGLQAGPAAWAIGSEPELTQWQPSHAMMPVAFERVSGLGEQPQLVNGLVAGRPGPAAGLIFGFGAGVALGAVAWSSPRSGQQPTTKPA